VQSWKEKNPGYEYRFYTDDDMDKMVAEDHPELVPLWKRMTGVLKADFFRYLVLFKYGGYYADIDVTCNTPIDDWFRHVEELLYTHQRIVTAFLSRAAPQPALLLFSHLCRYANVHHAAGLVVGFEIITGRRPDWYKWFSRKFQLCQVCEVAQQAIPSAASPFPVTRLFFRGAFLTPNLHCTVDDGRGPRPSHLCPNHRPHLGHV
jgi:hypothetical protein